MHIRCPHCHISIEIVEDSSFRDVECPSCGSHFNLVGGDAPTEGGPTKARTLGHFELIEQLGVGHFGAVWKAKDTTLDRFVAVKIPRKEQLDEEDIEKFFREARAAAQLRHPNIIGVHEVGREGDTIFIASDFVEGATLAEWLGGQPLPPKEAVQLCAKIADALHVAHEAGVVHRDLKPQNIMMDMDGEPHVMDFGLAKRDAGEITVTVEGALLGTPAYMPPEQAAGKGHEADQRSDVYSLGVILYQMLTGTLPFQGEKRMLLVQIQRDEPPSPRRRNAGIPRDLETICLKCLEKPPEKRYQLAGELSDDLGRFLDGRPIKARRIGRVARGWRWAKRNPTVASLAASVVLVLLGGMAGIAYWARVAASERQQAVSSLVHALSTASPSQVPEAIDVLRPFNGARPTLEQQYADTTGQRKLHTAYGLAAFGQVEAEFLVDAVGTAASGECGNLVTALRRGSEAALRYLHGAAADATRNSDWELKTRLATVALYLGDSELVAEMLRAFPREGEGTWDPVQRTMFIEYFPRWLGPVEQLVDVLKKANDKSLRSGVCLALGSIETATADAKEAWDPVLSEWYQGDTDSGVHSASSWALRAWKLTFPSVEKEERNGFDWFVTKTGLTMVRIPAGQLELPEGQTGDSGKTIRVERDFWLSDCEVTAGQYLTFLDDKTVENPPSVDERGIIAFNYGDPAVPIRHVDPAMPVCVVNWFEAVLFCNWLSQREGREPCYRKDGKERVHIDGEVVAEHAAWELVPGANGYRLPMEDEWEYACRAKTTTAYSFGDDQDLLDRYAVFIMNAKDSRNLVGGRLCNAWGLFNMHGNVSEWCQDWHTEASSRVYRGGDYTNRAIDCRSSERNGLGPPAHLASMGFRVATRATED